MTEEQWARNTKLWWKTSGYGHRNRIPVVVIEWSASRKRVYVRFPVLDSLGRHSGSMSSYVSPLKLEPRDE